MCVCSLCRKNTTQLSLAAIHVARSTVVQVRLRWICVIQLLPLCCYGEASFKNRRGVKV